MTNSWRYIAVVALLGVVLAQLVQGRSWGLGAMVLVAALAVACRRTRGARMALATMVKLGPWFGLAAVVGLAIQTVAVLAQGEFGRAGGLLPHPNFASANAVGLLMLASVGLTGMRRNLYGRISLIGASGMAAFLVLASGTRSLALGLILGVLVVMISLATVGRSPRFWALGATLLLALAGVVYGVTRLRGDIGQHLFSAFERGPIYLTALDIAELSPWIGLGDTAWSKWAPVVEPSLPLAAAAHAHSLPLATLIEGGAIGLAALLVLFVLLMQAAIVALHERSDVGNVVSVVGLIALTVQGAVDIVVLYPSVYVILVLVGLVAGARAVNRVPISEVVGR